MEIWLLSFFVVINVTVIIIFSVIYRKKKKVDTGFSFIYFKLSYRRKMIRTLWTTLFIIPALLLMYLTPVWNLQLKVIITMLLLLVFILQLAYNYFMWKKHEAHN